MKVYRTEPTGQVGGDLADLNDALSALNELKLQLMAREEATELFSRLRSDGLSAIWAIYNKPYLANLPMPRLKVKGSFALF